MICLKQQILVAKKLIIYPKKKVVDELQRKDINVINKKNFNNFLFSIEIK